MKPEGNDGYDKFADVCAKSGGAGAIYDFNQDLSTDGYWADFQGGFVYPWGRITVCDYSGTGTPPPAGTTIRIITSKPITTADTYEYKAPEASYDADVAKEDVKEINVFPNPYYGVNPQEINKYQRFVTFNHLPKKATIKIFNLAGQLVKQINKSSNSQYERWDLANDSGLPVASGVYIAYVDMPDLGTTKTLKVAIIQEQQILDRF
jgi:hypothetical protein